MRMPEALASFEGVDQALDLRFLDSGEDHWGWTPQSSATAAASRSSMAAATMLGLERCRGRSEVLRLPHKDGVGGTQQEARGISQGSHNSLFQLLPRAKHHAIASDSG